MARSVLSTEVQERVIMGIVSVLPACPVPSTICLWLITSLFFVIKMRAVGVLRELENKRKDEIRYTKLMLCQIVVNKLLIISCGAHVDEVCPACSLQHLFTYSVV